MTGHSEIAVQGETKVAHSLRCGYGGVTNVDVINRFQENQGHGEKFLLGVIQQNMSIVKRTK